MSDKSTAANTGEKVNAENQELVDKAHADGIDFANLFDTSSEAFSALVEIAAFFKPLTDVAEGAIDLLGLIP